ncbi:hypothetical protein AK812_SmicGene43284 [Symbiodinium microadriaticum]|uniref:Uncharacterized protein n=1 Tax=Symbiodinium microadriaticum TaxID=2951 RepID=A0A1Q9C1E9_SYMMI|nr:hypothetical protein AK812_SmicGene43284 [Symbiodinium microadriaticum]CAE7879709.1 unnamed protein product [Symbiodinium microadriaticum]
MLWVGNDDFNPILDLTHRILEHKIDQGQKGKKPTMKQEAPNSADVPEDTSDTLLAILTFWGMADAWFLNSDQHEKLWQVHLQHTQPSYTHASILSGIQKFLASEQHGMQGVSDFQSLEQHAHITVLNHTLEANSAKQADASENIPTKPVFYVHQKSLEQFFRFLHNMLEYRTRCTESYKWRIMCAKTPASAAITAEKKEESASTTSGTFSSQQLNNAKKSEDEDEADTRSSAPSNHNAEPDLPVADNKDRPDIGDSILTLYPQALQNIMTQKQDMVVVGAKVKPKRTWLASQGCIKARALIEQVRRIDLEEFHDLYQQHRQLDPPNSKNLYALTITNVRQTNVDFNYYQMTAPSLFTRYRTAPSDLCPLSSAIGWVRPPHVHCHTATPTSQESHALVPESKTIRTSATATSLPTVLPITLATLLEHLDAWALQNLLQTSKCGHDSPQHQSLRRDARALRQALTILTHDIRLPGLPIVYDVTITPQHLLDQQPMHRSLHASITNPETSAPANPTDHNRHMQELLRQGEASTFTELVKKMNHNWQQDKRFQAFLHFLNDSRTTVSYTPQFSQSEYHFRDIISPEMAQGSSSPLSILTATTTTREANTREHNLKEHYNEHGSGFPWSHYPTAAVPQFAIRAPDSLQMQVESLVNIMFDPTAQSIITDEQIRHWQLYLQNKTYADPYYTFPNDFIHDCIFHFNSALHREVKGFIQHAIHHIHHNKEHQPNIKLILWQRNLRFRCKVQPFPFSTWRQLIYDAELDDLANSVGFTFREEQL